MNSLHKTSAVVLGAHKIGLGLIRSLGKEGVPVVSIHYHDRDMGYSSRYVKESHVSPHPEEEEEPFIEFITELGKKNPGSILYPSDDPSLFIVSKYKLQLSELFTVSAPDFEIVKTCIEKENTYRLAEDLGVRCPRTLVTASADEAVSFAGEIGSPFILKPTVGHRFFEIFRRKMVLISDFEEVSEWMTLFSQHGLEVMVQEYIPGDDSSGVNFNSFFINDELFYTFTAQKIRLSPRGTGFPVVIISRYIPELFEPSKKLLSGLGYTGFSNVEYKRDKRDGNFVLMEINPRHNLSSQHAVRCGYNFPYLSYLYEIGEEWRILDNKFEEGVYWIDPGKDFAEYLKHIGKNPFSPAAFVRPYLSKKVYTIPSLADPAPMMKRCRDFAVEGVHRLKRIVRSDDAK